MVEYKCKSCGKICYAKYKSQIRKYCSHECANRERWANTDKKRSIIVCETCKKEFTVNSCDSRLKTGSIKYCSKECMGIASRKGEYRRCQRCGDEFYTTRKTRRFCTKECANAYNKAKYVHKAYMENGYLVEYVPGYNKKSAVKQHRRIMEEYLGRRLRSDEVVHHVNGIKTDNRIENLQVMTVSEHSSIHRKREKEEGKHLFGGYNNN